MISLIVAASEDGVIGRDGTLPWRLPADLRRFKAITLGHPIVMGRKTWESIGCRPLPGRLNIVLTRDASACWPGCTVCHCPDEAIAFAKSAGLNSDGGIDAGEIFIIGGSAVYQLFLHRADRIYLTRVHTIVPDGDAHFPAIDEAEWRIVEEERHDADDAHTCAYTFQTLVRS